MGGSVDQELIARSMRDLAREFDSCRDLLVALGNESRQLIFMALLESHGGARVGELAERVGLSRPFVADLDKPGPPRAPGRKGSEP